MHAGPLITTPSALLLFSPSSSSSLTLSPSSSFLFFPSRSYFPLPVVTCLLSSFSPALLLTSSAVFRPLHEANAHSGLAITACMRSTGGPIKRRQEQETERETGSALPRGPRRYRHCPHPLYVSAAVPELPCLPPSRRVCPQTDTFMNASSALAAQTPRTPCCCSCTPMCV